MLYHNIGVSHEPGKPFMFLTLHRFRLLCASLALLLLLVSASGRAFAEPPKVVPAAEAGVPDPAAFASRSR